jgi:hypothetical protein
MDIAQTSLRRLRTAIQNSEVSFPSQVPIFVCQSRADIQWRMVELYFVHNWSCGRLGERYGVAMERIRQLISQWVRRAAAVGYLQEIPPPVTTRLPRTAGQGDYWISLLPEQIPMRSAAAATLEAQ